MWEEPAEETPSTVIVPAQLRVSYPWDSATVCNIPLCRTRKLHRAAVCSSFDYLISERTKAAPAAKVARDGQWDRNASHHLKPGAGQQAAAEAVREQAHKRAQDLSDFIAQLQAEGVASLRRIAHKLNEGEIETPRGGQWGPSSVRNLPARIEV